MADGLVQGQNRDSASAVTRLISLVVSARARARPKRAVRLTTSRPGGGAASTDASAPPAMQTTGRCLAVRTPGPGELEHTARHLAVERRGIEVPLPGDGQVGPLQTVAEADQPGHEVEAGLDPGAERDEPARQPACRAAAGDAGDVDARLTPVAGGDLDEALAERRDLCRRGALLRPEHGGGVTEACRHVAGDDELHSPQRLWRSHGLVRAEAAVGRRRSRRSRPRSAVPPRRGRPGGAGPRRRWWRAPGRRAGVAAGGPAPRRATSRPPPSAAPLPSFGSSMRHSASTRAPRGPVTSVVCATPPSARSRPSPPSDIGTSSAVHPAARAAPAMAAATSPAEAVPRNLSGAATRWGTR